jgi:hypothetical protein
LHKRKLADGKRLHVSTALHLFARACLRLGRRLFFDLL